jgi:hypothetical protein
VTEAERLAVRRARMMQAARERINPTPKQVWSSTSGRLGKEASNRAMGSDRWQTLVKPR